MRTLTVVFQPAHAAHLRDADLPALPSWFPPPSPECYTDADRHRARVTRAREEAARGPLDARKERRVYGDGEQPEPLLSIAGGFTYRLDRHSSSPHQVVYRYAPDLSPGHPAAMAGVVEAFEEVGARYAAEAREGDRPDADTAPAVGAGLLIPGRDS